MARVAGPDRPAGRDDGMTDDGDEATSDPEGDGRDPDAEPPADDPNATSS